MFQNEHNIVNQLYSNKIYKKKINVFQIGGIQTQQLELTKTFLSGIYDFMFYPS